MTSKFVKIDPPGTLCAYEALRDVVRRTNARSFIDVGCGGGGYSKLLCSLGMAGTGIDVSARAIEKSSQVLEAEISAGAYKLIQGDATSLGQEVPLSDIGISFMVMEHIEDEVGFIRSVSQFVRTDGYVAIGVPGRMDLWSFEDETVGHLRRYDRKGLRDVLEAGGLSDVEVWSVAVPVANMLFRAGQYLVRHSNEAQKVGWTQKEQTEASGLQEVPWKTMFPPWVGIVLNRFTLYPVLQLQRLFYRTEFGLTLLGFGRVRNSN